MRRSVSLAVVGILGVLAAFPPAQAAVKPTEEKRNLPAVWQAAPSAELYKALRVAELDALRLLTERIYGMYLDSDTTVYDLVLADDTVRTSVSRCIKGITTTEKPEYRDDGQVWIVRAIKLRQILETITENVKKKEILGRMVTVERLTEKSLETRDTTVDVMGNGALPGSDGLRKIQAKRAAEVDAYRKLAERLMGVQITSTTTVKDFILKSDVIKARTAQLVKGAKPVSVKYLDDKSCEVEMQIKVADIFQVIKVYKGPDREMVKQEQEYAATTFTETGHGAPRPLKDDAIPSWAPTSESEAVDGAFQETEVIIKRLVGQGVVID